MPQKRFSDEQVKEILAENKAGKPASELIKQHNISATTFYKWKEKFDPEYQAQRAARAQRAQTKPRLEKRNAKRLEVYGGLNNDERRELLFLRSENTALKARLYDASQEIKTANGEKEQHQEYSAH